MRKKPTFRDEWVVPVSWGLGISAVLLLLMGYALAPGQAKRPDGPVAIPSSTAFVAPVDGSGVRIETNVVSPEAHNPAPTFVAQDIRTFNALQNNCFNAIRNNGTGEYPAMQRMSCADYQRMANKLGIRIDPLPPALEAVPVQRRVPYENQVATMGNPPMCAAWYAEKENINARMRAGYREPAGERMRERIRQLNDLLYENHCTETSFDR